jgi:hypothetical protein
MPTLRKKISGSIEGEATQKVITGAKGTPPINSVVTTGITPQEQNGLKAPTIAANPIAASGRARSARPIYLEKPATFIAAATGIVIKR